MFHTLVLFSVIEVISYGSKGCGNELDCELLGTKDPVVIFDI